MPPPAVSGARRAALLAILTAVSGLHPVGRLCAQISPSRDASFGVWPWLVGNIDASTPGIIARAQSAGTDTIYLHLYRTTGPQAGILYMADETGLWPPSLGATVPHVHLRSFIQQAHNAGIQVVGVVNCFLADGPLPGNQAHEQLLRDVIQHLLSTFMPGGEMAYGLDGIALDRVRFEHGTANPASAVTSFVQSVKTLCGATPLHAYLPANLYHIDGPPYNGTFRPYAEAMALLSGQYGQDWEALASILDVMLPMAYVAEGGIYGSNTAWMQAYLQTVSAFARQAQAAAASPGLRVVPCIRAWNDSTGATTPSSLNACMTGALSGGADGFMSFRYFTSLGQASWWTAIAGHCAPGADLPVARLHPLQVSGLTVALTTAATSSLHPPLLTRYDFDGDGVFDTPWSASPTAQILAPSAGSFTVAAEVMDALGRRAGTRRRIAAGALALTVNPGVLSLSQGGLATIDVHAGPMGAGQTYVLGLSGSGVSPGLALPGGLVVPLNPDDWLHLSLSLANGPVLPSFQGALSPSGGANGWISLPGAALPAALMFHTIHIGGAIFDPVQARFSATLPSVPLVFLP